MASPIPSDEEIGLTLRALDQQKASTPSDDQIALALREMDRIKINNPTLNQGGSSVGYDVRQSLSPILGPTEEQNRGTINRSIGLVPSLVEMSGVPSKVISSRMPSAQDLQDVVSAVRDPERFVDPDVPRETAGTMAKVASGVLKGNANALGYVAALGPILGPLAESAPLTSRAIELGIAGDIAAHLPDMVGSIYQAAEAGDDEAVAEGLTGMGLGLFFGAKSAENALRQGIAAESPLLSRVLTKEIKTKLSKDDLKGIYSRVATGEGTPSEVELIKWVRDNPKQFVGAELRESRIKSDWLNEYLGLQPSRMAPRASGTDLPENGSTGRTPGEPVTKPNEESTEVQTGGKGQSVPRQIEGKTQEVARPVTETVAEAPVVESATVPLEGNVPLGLNRPAKPNPNLQSLSEDELQNSIMAQRKVVDQMEREWDLRELSVQEKQNLGKSQDELTALELEVFRRRTSDTDSRDLSLDLLNKSDFLSGEFKDVVGDQKFQEFKIIAEELAKRRTGNQTFVDAVSELGPSLASSNDFQEMAGSRFNRVKELLEFVKQSNTPSAYGSKPIVEFEGPNGKVQATFDGYQDLTPIGKGIQPQFTVMTEGNPDLVNRGSFISEGLAKKGYNPVSEFPTFEQWKAQPRASLAPEASIPEPEIQSPSVSSTGPENIRAMLQTSGATDSTLKVWDDILNQPVMQRPEFRDLQVVLKDKLQLGGTAAKGIVDTLNKVVELSRSDADPETLAHEIFHLAHETLTPSDNARVANWRREEIEKKYGSDAPATLLSGNMTSEEFAESGLPIEDYHLINDSEYLAQIGSDPFTSENFASRNTGEGRTLIQKIKEFIRGLLESVRRMFGFSPTREQFVRDILQGKRTTTPRSGEKFEKRASFVRTPKEAENAEKLMQTKQQEVAEGRDQVGQVSDIVKTMEKHGIATASPGAQNLLGYSDYVGIVTTGERLLGQKGMDYRALKPTLDPYQQKWIARLATTQQGLFERKMAEVEREYGTELKKVSSPTFAKLLAKEAAAKAESDMADLNVKIMNAMFDTAIRKSQRVLRKERKSEMEIDQIKGQIQEIEEAKSSSVAMSQLLQDMVSVLSSTPEGVQLLNDPNFGKRTDIQKVYKDIKISAGQPLHSPTLIKWASYLLQKSKALRENLVAAYMANQSPLRTAMNGYETQLVNGLQNDPVKTIKDLRRDYGDLKTEANQAKFAYRTLHKRVVDGLKRFDTLQEAMDVIGKIKADPDYNSLVSEMRKDASWIGEQKPMEVFTDKTVMLPDGKTLDVSPDYFVGSKTLFQQNRGEMENAITDLKTWLNDPANAENPDYNTHLRNLETLQDYFTGQALMQPGDQDRVFSTTFGILQNQVDLIGGRIAVGMRKSLRKYELMQGLSSQWTQHWTNELTNSRIAAMQSHGMEWGSFGSKKQSLAEANKVWWDMVGNVLNYSHNRQGVGFKIGDTLPTGWKVTKADVEAMRMQSTAADEGYKIVDKTLSAQDQPYVTDSLGGFVYYRKPLKGTESMTPRSFNIQMRNIGRDVSEAFEKHSKAVQSGDTAAASKALNDLNSIYDQTWKILGPSLVWDRNPDFARATPFDGPGGGYDVLAPDVHKTSTATEFFDFLSNYTGYSVAEAREISMLEWSRSISDWYREASAEADSAPVRAQESPNSFTRARLESLAPYAFYENGFKNTSSLMRVSSGMQSRALDEVASSFSSAEQDIQRQIGKFEQDVQVLRATGSNNPKQEALIAQRIARQNGENYDNYDKLQKRLQAAKSGLASLRDREIETADTVIGRYIGFVSGALIGIASTMRNVYDGPKYSGRAANRLMASNLKSYPVAMWYGLVRAQLPMILSGMYSALKGSALIAKGGMAATYRAIMNPDRSGRQFVLDAMEPFLKEIGEDLYNRIKVLKEMQDRGIVDRVPTVAAEMNARLMGSLLNRGQILSEDLSPLQKAALAPLSIAELLFLFPSQKVNPKFGDYGLNASIYMMMRSRVGPITFFEQRFKAIADQIKNGARAWDPSNPENHVNRLTHQEMYPRGLSELRFVNGESDLAQARDMFQKSGMDLDKIAFRVISETLAGKPASISQQEVENLTSTAINMENRGTVANSPQFAKSRSSIARFLSPFWNWPTRMFSQFMNQMSIPAQSGSRVKNESEYRKAKAAQWAYSMMAVILPFLILGAVIGTIGNEEHRQLKKLVYNQLTAYRQPWERDGAKSQGIGWAVEGLNNIPILGGLISMAINDTPVRATTDPSFVMVDKIKQAFKYAGGVAQTGDFGYKLPEFIMGMIPDARIVLSRMEAFEGRSELNNAANILRRYGPMDQMKPMGGRDTGNVATELTPYADRMVNAAIQGDDQGFQSIYAEAVETARSLGKENPERVVREMFRSRNPYDRVFKSKLTNAERERILQSATSEERALVEQVENRFERASSQIGSTSSFTSEQAQSNRRSRSIGDSESAYTSMPASRSSGVPRFSQYNFRSGRSRRSTRLRSGSRSRGTRRSSRVRMTLRNRGGRRRKASLSIRSL